MADQCNSPARRDCTRCALCWCSLCALGPAASCSAPERRCGSPAAGEKKQQSKSSHRLKSEVFEISIRGGKTEPLPSRPSARRAWSSSANSEKYVLECSMPFFPFTYSSLKYRQRGKKSNNPKTHVIIIFCSLTYTRDVVEKVEAHIRHTDSAWWLRSGWAYRRRLKPSQAKTNAKSNSEKLVHCDVVRGPSNVCWW